MTIDVSRRLITVEEYHRMGEVGILTEADKVELINGEIINKMTPIGSRHASYVKRINAFLGKVIGDKAIIGVQDPVVLGTFSEPEPDISILKHKEDFYELAHPASADVWLIIEVADSSLKRDRELKLPVYAEAGIPELWIIDVDQQQVEAYHQPSGNLYKVRQIAQPGEKLLLPGLDIEISVSGLLGKSAI